MQLIPSPARRRRRRLSLSTAVLVGIACFAGGGQAAALDPSGLWLTPGEGSIIKIAPCKSAYCGTLAWLKEPTELDGSPKLDVHNAEAAKRARPMLGMDIILDLVPEDSHWRGKAYNPQDGKLYDVTFRLVDDSPLSNKAEIEGCVLRILCQTQVLTRVVAVPKPGATP